MNNAETMNVKIIDYPCVKDKLAELGCVTTENIAILPPNFAIATTLDDLKQLSESATVRTLFRNNGLKLDDIIPQNSKTLFIQNNDFEWMAPTLFFTAAQLAQDPNIVSVSLNIISNYIYDFMKGLPGKHKTKLSVVIEQNGTHLCKKISYEGEIEGLKQLPKIIKEAFND